MRLKLNSSWFWYWPLKGWHFRWGRLPLIGGSILIRQLGPWRSFSRWKDDK